MRPHPVYCDHFKDGDDLTACEEREEHASRTIEAHVGDELVAIFVRLVRIDPSDDEKGYGLARTPGDRESITFIDLTIREDDEERSHPLLLPQARLLANGLRRLLDLEKRPMPNRGLR